jgi:hypothetical protein
LKESIGRGIESSSKQGKDKSVKKKSTLVGYGEICEMAESELAANYRSAFMDGNCLGYPLHRDPEGER